MLYVIAAEEQERKRRVAMKEVEDLDVCMTVGRCIFIQQKLSLDLNLERIVKYSTFFLSSYL